MRLKNITNKVKPFKLKEGWKSLLPGESAELPEGVYENETGLEIVKVEPVKEETSDIIITKTYNKSQLKALKKQEQQDLLKEYGLSNKEIKSLRFELQRIKKLLELQDAK